MGTAQRKEKEKEIRRNDIIDAAEKVFFSKGFDATTMDDVAREAEFSKRTIYVYFNSKDQIYFEIMVRGYKILIEMMETEIQYTNGKNALDKIKQMGKVLYKFSQEYMYYFMTIIEYENGELDFANGISDKSRQECYALGEKIFTYLTSALKSGVEEGSIRYELDIVNTAIILWSCIVGIFTTLHRKRNYIMNYHNRESNELLLNAFDMLIRSIENGGIAK
ncbi:TetR/AcrR family transcriptional regulator [Clostridium brassicae]|uniref:TetR/AcrR family transcriptional regulator n=1 Tax=Clostridium brassicae TaxID=2999072 RepID=A0ABT4DCY8_9CLOT|nr:TetR/AcrR family transcriptional regulator [Clostridium brassicae]MCY6960177.1 TetR/AcrR family transcriptional regulator [Clostridium brassicae]